MVLDYYCDMYCSLVYLKSFYHFYNIQLLFYQLSFSLLYP
uniref:Uncharacterized protein n=1 Tax=Myoviridae sp. ctNQV2 TaxID=2827683 RepID=A0A8S5RZU7_9CAUD|nr:MAG TPA: hypothetical protein [Myoviridae sp. ctNQV2]